MTEVKGVKYQAEVTPLAGMKKNEYDKLKRSGMFYEWYPKATGNFLRDTMDYA